MRAEFQCGVSGNDDSQVWRSECSFTELRVLELRRVAWKRGGRAVEGKGKALEPLINTDEH